MPRVPVVFEYRHLTTAQRLAYTPQGDVVCEPIWDTDMNRLFIVTQDGQFTTGTGIIFNDPAFKTPTVDVLTLIYSIPIPSYLIRDDGDGFEVEFFCNNFGGSSANAEIRHKRTGSGTTLIATYTLAAGRTVKFSARVIRIDSTQVEVLYLVDGKPDDVLDNNFLVWPVASGTGLTFEVNFKRSTSDLFTFSCRARSI